jgi:hypothetical protein
MRLPWLRDIMGRVNVVLSDEMEHRLRKTLVDMPEYGGKKGDISKAIEEALDEWIDRQLEKSQHKSKK